MENQFNNFENNPNNYGYNPNEIQYNQFQGVPQNFQNMPQYNDFQNYSNFNNGKNKKPKRRSGCLVALLKFFLVVLLLIGIIVGIVFGIFTYKNNKKKQEDIEYIESQIFIDNSMGVPKEYIEKIKSTQSDIEGLTVYEKIEEGLQGAEGSDTDGDGLTDKEEIEIYHSDPLKASTSGDGIPDSFKVSNDLEIQKKYSVNEVGYTGYNKFSNIDVKDKNDKNAVISITEIEGYSVQGCLAEKVYDVCDYDGKIEIDFSEYIKKGSEYLIFKKDYDFDAEYEVLKDKNGVVNFDTKGKDCVVGLVNIASVTNNSFLDINSDVQMINMSDESLVIILPITIFTGQLDIYIMEKDIFGFKTINRSQELTNWFMEKSGYGEEGLSIKVVHSYVDPIQFNIISKIFSAIENGSFVSNIIEKQGVEVSTEDVSMFRKVMSFFVSIFHVDKDEWDTLFQEVEEPEEIEPEKKEKPSRYVSTFDVSKDALPFPNFGTYISKGGNCAGFSMITAQLFNNNLYGKTDELYYDEKTYTYDISDMNEFSTFFDKGLNDYKTENYWKSTYPDMSELTRSDFEKKDAEFLDFIGYKWAEGNNVDHEFLYWNDEIKWSEFEKVLDYFAEGDRIAYFASKIGDGGHAVNIYGFEQDSDNPNIWYGLIYDNNFPNNRIKDSSGKVHIINNRLKIVKKTPLFGEPYIEYEYYPLPDYLKDYRMNSYAYFNMSSMPMALSTVMQMHYFVICDEQGNVIVD